MINNSRGSVGLAILLFLLAIAISVGNLVVVASQSDPNAVLSGETLQPLLAAQYEKSPAHFLFLAVSPLVLGLIAALAAGRRPASAPAARAAAPQTDSPSSDASALRLLGLLQQEARFVDFIREDIDGYDDSQVGAAARSIHAGCRKTLDGRIELEKILPQEEGSQVEIERGFDPAAIRLIGKVTGEPPFRGTLEHPGWRVAKVQLPESPGHLDPAILTPAEVEIR